MYKFTNSTMQSSAFQNPTWVKMQSNGSFCLCDYMEADGVVLAGKVYTLNGKPSIEGHDSVVVSEISEEEYLQQLADRQTQTESAIAELSILVASTQQTDGGV